MFFRGQVAKDKECVINLQMKDIENPFSLQFILDLAKREQRPIIIYTRGLKLSKELQDLFDKVGARIESDSLNIAKMQ